MLLLVLRIHLLASEAFLLNGKSRIVCTDLVELITSNASDSLLERDLLMNPKVTYNLKMASCIISALLLLL